jgi:acyl-CoA thioesterase-1
VRSFHVLVYSFVLSILLAMSASARPVTIVALGDSLTAGYQLPASAALPAALERSLRAAGVDVRIENAGVSGDTSSGGLERLDWATPDGIDGVILALGANDMLRGLDPRLTEKALDETIRRLKARNIAVLLVGMVAPPSMGKEYVSSFNGIYPKLAERHGVALYPFMLEGIAQNPKLNLPDGIHPNREGVEVIAKGMLPLVTQFVEQIARGKTPGR